MEGEREEGATPLPCAIRQSRVVKRLVKAPPSTSLFLPPGSAEGGRFPPQWTMHGCACRRFRKVLYGGPQATLRSLASFQDADCMKL